MPVLVRDGARTSHQPNGYVSTPKHLSMAIELVTLVPPYAFLMNPLLLSLL